MLSRKYNTNNNKDTTFSDYRFETFKFIQGKSDRFAFARCWDRKGKSGSVYTTVERERAKTMAAGQAMEMK
jgi:hypothetical protein